MAKVKITVVKRALHDNLIDQYINRDRYPDGFGACSLWSDGQEFLIEDWPAKPEGFPCDWAWADIQRDVAMVLFGGNPPWMVRDGMALTCCSDGFRPVSFLVERLTD